MNRYRSLAFVYGLVLLGIVALASSGRGGGLFRLARELPGGDQGGHFLLSGAMAYLLARAFPEPVHRLGELTLARANLVLAVLLAGEELLQVVLPARTADPLDLAADLLGILVFGWLAGTGRGAEADPHHGERGAGREEGAA